MKTGPVALIIDDEKQIGRLVICSLESERYQVFDAESAEQGLTEAVYRRPDVIVLDLGLPDMDGVEVLRRLREMKPQPRC